MKIHSNISLRHSDNGGYLIDYYKQEKPTGSGEFSSYQNNTKQEVFGKDEKDKAWERFHALNEATDEKKE
jgi:hypothetical protein